MLKNKVAIVTGGTRGIGYAVVEKFLQNGATVVLFGSRQETVTKAVASLKEKNEKYYLCNGCSDFSSLYTINKGKVITHEYFNCHSAKGTDRTSQSVFKKDKKIIKNLGYLKAAKYNKYRDSYNTVTSSINFVKNTSANRNNILKSYCRSAK